MTYFDPFWLQMYIVGFCLTFFLLASLVGSVVHGGGFLGMCFLWPLTWLLIAIVICNIIIWNITDRLRKDSNDKRSNAS